MAAALIYLATLSFVPVFLGYLSFFFTKRTKLISNERINSDILILLLIFIFSFINKIIGYNKATVLQDFIPETALMILMYWVSSSFTKSAIRILIIFTIIETLVVFLEYYLNINSFMPGLHQEFKESDLLYDSRPYGLSSNTSVIALKIFLSVLLLFKYKPFSKANIHLIAILILFIGLVVTFNRTVIISLFIFIGLLFIKNLRFSKKYLIGAAFLFTGILLLILSNYDLLLYQLTRGKEGVSILSGRVEIWQNFIDFIQKNVFLGNNSYKYYISYYGRKAHAHSSFLQIFATHGIIISLLYLILIIKNINKNNYVFILPILIFSLSQYGIFWGFSITDIVLFTFMFNKNLDNEENSKAIN